MIDADAVAVPTLDDRALTILRDIYGYGGFRGRQAKIIRHVASGGDAFVLMPTGGGKSLCYQVPALLRNGVAIVVSPLIALMEDQVAALRENGVRAGMLNSSVSGRDQNELIQSMQEGAVDIVYMAPERLLTPTVLELLKTIDLALFAIDEAHCVSQWGHDFRPEYLDLSKLHDFFPNVPRIALTATADNRTRLEIVERLNLHTAATFIDSFDRPNIRYSMQTRDGAGRQLLTFLSETHPTDSGIVYCLSRKKTESVAKMLNDAGRVALPYHAGMDQDTRRKNQMRFLREEGLVMVATIAFGMGIDKPDVRFVAHVDLPRSIEAYYQETGRAGRDGLAADAWMAYSPMDVATYRNFIDQSEADEAHKRVERSKLNALINLCEATTCRRQALLAYFGEVREGQCGNCDSCLSPAESWNGTLAARKALFVVRATGQRFGAKYLIDILTANTNERIVQFGHDQISAFGKGAELNVKEWHSVFRQLIAHDYLMADIERYGSLRLTDKSLAVLTNKETVMLRKEAPKLRRAEREILRARGATQTLKPTDQLLFDALRARRRQLATEQGVPPYVIFHDAALKAIAEARPSSLTDLRQIPGVGERKLASYGKAILETVASH